MLNKKYRKMRFFYLIWSCLVNNSRADIIKIVQDVEEVIDIIDQEELEQITTMDDIIEKSRRHI